MGWMCILDGSFNGLQKSLDWRWAWQVSWFHGWCIVKSRILVLIAYSRPYSGYEMSFQLKAFKNKNKILLNSFFKFFILDRYFLVRLEVLNILERYIPYK